MRSRYPETQDIVLDRAAEEAAAWYVMCRQGELSATASEAFVQWLRRSPLHAAEYLAISGLAHALPNAAHRSQLSLEKLVAEASTEPEVTQMADLRSPSPPARRDPALRNRRSTAVHGRRFLFGVAFNHKLAAGFAATAIVGALGAALGLRPVTSGQQFITHHGEQRTWQLADLSVLRLNSDSAVNLRFDAHRREVILARGQAYFEVAKEPARPFRVRTPSAILTAVGTAFDVYEQGGATVVTVADGRVAVSRGTGPIDRPLAELAKGDQVHISSGGRIGAIDRADVPNATAWVRQEIAFKREPITAVVAQFNRYNHVQILVDDAQVGDVRISGVFRSYDVQSFIDFLNQLPGVRVVTRDQRATVSAAR